MSIVWKVRGVSVSGLLVVVWMLSMLLRWIWNHTYLGRWLLGVRCRAARCASRKRDAARLALSSGI